MSNNFAEDYVDVAERLRLFRDKYPEGSLQPADLSCPYRVETVGSQTFVVYVAAAFRTADDIRPGVGIAWEEVPGKTNFTRGSELMNAETSAWGRAIVAVLAAETKRVASRNEVENRRQDTEADPLLGESAKQAFLNRIFELDEETEEAFRKELDAATARKDLRKWNALRESDLPTLEALVSRYETVDA